MDTVRNIVNWLVWSSANKDKLSLTVVSVVSLFVLVGADQVNANMIGNQAVDFVASLGQTLFKAGLLWGSVRKVFLTLREATGW